MKWGLMGAIGIVGALRIIEAKELHQSHCHSERDASTNGYAPRGSLN
jgi:hypothetical protein